ncbi:MAG: gamma-glutamylcyclotransferase family protein [Verrucomicrobiota bacterium]
MELAFVYGTLRSGGSNFWRMERARFVERATVEGVLVKVDWYPGLVLGGGGRCLGEVYEVDELLVRELDEFEGIGIPDERNGEYARVRAEVLLESGERVSCWVYEWLLGVGNYEVVETGDWFSVM